ncbi:MAG TPA: hypothetical protein VGO73_05265 [Pyrinomonadaceae bacterium]|jgi:hypothetical protein|nr:hypothetical protein [Pyrinomonadaceae bacterium]
MATYTPPPYFPQGSLAPPDKNRYKKFKLMIFGIVVLLLLLLGGIGWFIWHLLRSAF